MSISKEFKVTYIPLDTTQRVYYVEASDENKACNKAYDKLRFDIGHDFAKDFELNTVTVSYDPEKEINDE